MHPKKESIIKTSEQERKAGQVKIILGNLEVKLGRTEIVQSPIGPFLARKQLPNKNIRRVTPSRYVIFYFISLLSFISSMADFVRTTTQLTQIIVFAIIEC